MAKTAFINARGKFDVHFANNGLYKIEVYHPGFYFESVVVQILSEEQM